VSIESGVAPRPDELPARPPRAPAVRRGLIRGIYVLLSLYTLMMSMGVVMLAAGKVPDGPYAFAAAGTTAWKLLSLGGYLVIAWTAGRSVLAVQWVLLGDLTWWLAEVIAPQDPSDSFWSMTLRYLVNAAIFLGPWFLLAPERREVWHLRAQPDRVALAITVLAVPLLGGWAWTNAQLGVADVDGISGAELVFDVTGLALVFATVGVLAALRPRGKRWLLWVVAAGALYLGIDALVTPSGDLASPELWGALAFIAGGLILGWRARQHVLGE
jgi:hypothetical protein